jgi:uncharacterized protein
VARALVDTAVFAYALGADHPYREPCRAIVADAARGALRLEASADLIQELAHVRLRRTGDRALAADDARDAAALCDLHEVRADDAIRALALFRDVPSLTARDAVVAAIALGRGIPAILSPDRDFDAVPGLARVDPADRPAVARLQAGG